MIKKTSRSFVNEFIPKVSRTFALAIKFLPPDLRHSVFTAYLLCRVADTIEDSPYIKSDEKTDRLIHLKNLLNAASNGTALLSTDLIPLYKGIDPEQGQDHRLLGESNKLFDVLGELPEKKRQIIYRWAAEMAGGMAEFAYLTGDPDGRIQALENTAQWDRYCYYVAGTVGHMLTDLFIDQYDLNGHTAEEMKRLCNSFGLGLQKVNTIKDVPGDMKRGVVFLPKDIMAKYGLSPQRLADAANPESLAAFVAELVENASSHLDDAIEYISLLPTRPKGVRIFLTVPVILAQATLNLISQYPVQAMVGPAVKISRIDVARLTAMSRLHSQSNKALSKYYLELKNKRK